MHWLLVSGLVLRNWRNALRTNPDSAKLIGALVLLGAGVANVRLYRDLAMVPWAPVDGFLMAAFTTALVTVIFLLQWSVPGAVTRAAEALPVRQSDLSIGLLVPSLLAGALAPVLLGAGALVSLAGKLPVTNASILVFITAPVSLAGAACGAAVLRVAEVLVTRVMRLPPYLTKLGASLLCGGGAWFMYASGSLDAVLFLATPVPTAAMVAAPGTPATIQLLLTVVTLVLSAAWLVMFVLMYRRWPVAGERADVSGPVIQLKSWSGGPVLSVAQLYLLQFLRMRQLGPQTLATLLFSGFLVHVSFSMIRIAPTAPAFGAMVQSLKDFAYLLAGVGPGMLVLAMSGLHRSQPWLWRTLPVSKACQLGGRLICLHGVSSVVGLGWMIAMGALHKVLMPHSPLERGGSEYCDPVLLRSSRGAGSAVPAHC